MYCNFNPKVFNDFVSKGIKIKPQFSDDWQIVPQKGTKLNTITLKSDKLNQTVTDIDFYNFLKFLNSENIATSGLKIQGEYIIGNESPGMRKVYNKKMYQDFLNKFALPEKKFNIKDLVIGSEVELMCGMMGIYIGSAYRVDTKTPKKIHVIRSFNEPVFEYVETKHIKKQYKKVLSDKDSRKSYVLSLSLGYLNSLYAKSYSPNKERDFVLIDYNKYSLEEIKEKFIIETKISKMSSKFWYPGDYGDYLLNRFDLNLVREDENLYHKSEANEYDNGLRLIRPYRVPKSLLEEFETNGVPDLINEVKLNV